MNAPASPSRLSWSARLLIGLTLIIIGGAAGNLIDRIVVGSVVDFVDVYWRTYHFWAFNVADSAISVGVCSAPWWRTSAWSGPSNGLSMPKQSW